MRDLDYSLVDRKITDLLTSPNMKEIIAEALRASMSSLSQRIHVEIQEIAENIIGRFKNALGDGLLRFCNDWEDKNNLLEVVPENTRLLKTIGDYKLVVVEQKPVVRTVNFSTNLGEGLYRLAFPYVVFLIWLKRNRRIDDRIFPVFFQLAYGRIPLKSLSSDLYRPNLPNINSDHSVCIGDGVQRRLNALDEHSVATVSNAVIEGFWGSTFNNDLRDMFLHVASSDERFSTLAAWQAESTKDPLFVLEKQWTGRNTLQAIISMSNVNSDLKMRVGPVIEQAVAEASYELRELINDLSDQEAAAIADVRAVNVFRNRLYHKLFEACCSVLKDARSKEPVAIKYTAPEYSFSYNEAVKEARYDIW